MSRQASPRSQSMYASRDNGAAIQSSIGRCWDFRGKEKARVPHAFAFFAKGWGTTDADFLMLLSRERPGFRFGQRAAKARCASCWVPTLSQKARKDGAPSIREGIGHLCA